MTTTDNNQTKTPPAHQQPPTQCVKPAIATTVAAVAARDATHLKLLVCFFSLLLH